MALLSITMPTRNRPELFARALSSVLMACGPVSGQVEVTISDGSDDRRTGELAKRLLTDWPGGYQYVWNSPALPMADNLNRAMELSRGEWVHQLHDDDYLLPGAGARICHAVQQASGEHATRDAVLLFGVDVVNADGSRRRRQAFHRDRYLEPPVALRRVLRNSSFVRHPGIVIGRRALDETGFFDPRMAVPIDVDLWVRLFSRYGVRCVPHVVAAYTIHESTMTTGMWHPETIRVFGDIFDRAISTGVVPEHKIRCWQADFLHQFILAGAYRRLRPGRRAEAREVLRLFDLPAVSELGVSLRWLVVRAVFAVAVGRSATDRARDPVPH